MKMQRANFLTALVLGMGAVSVTVMGCELISSVDRTQIPEAAGGTGGGGVGGMSSSTGPGMGGAGGIGMGGAGGSGGGMGGCMSPSDCPVPANECEAATCDMNTCGAAPVAMGDPAKTQTEDDCKENVCDGMGGITMQNDNEDVFDDMKECTTDGCSNGNPTHVAKATGTACTMANMEAGKCIPSGDCVACVNDYDCTDPEVCQANKCVAEACQNLVKDGMETDVDCGGPDCGPCANNKICMVGSDCLSLVCPAGTLKCAAATCADMTQNQMESDTDCGGPCPDCANGKKCVNNNDCVSGSCGGGICLPSCIDGEKGIGETDVDCGGLTCPDCADGKMCLLPTDCLSGNCMLGTCAPQPSGAGGAGGMSGAGGAGGMGVGGAGMGGAGGN